MPEFAIYMEVDAWAASLRADEWDELVEVGDTYHAAWTAAPSGRLAVQLTLPAETLQQAVELALLLVPHLVERTTVGRVTPLRIEAMTDAEFRAALQRPAIPELVGVTEAAAMLGVTEQAVRQAAEKGRYGAFRIGKSWAFPKALVVRA